MAQFRYRLPATSRAPVIWAIGIAIGIGAGAVAAVGLAERGPATARGASAHAIAPR